MKHFLLCLYGFIFSIKFLDAQNVGIGTTTPASSAKLDVTSTNSGLLPPRMTTLQRDAISNPTPGLMIFNTDQQEIEVYTIYGWHIIRNSLPSLERLYGGGGPETPGNILQTLDGGYIVAGSTGSSASGDVGVNHGSGDFWIIKLDGTGNIVWNKLLGGSQNEDCKTIQQTTDGGFIVGGFSSSSANGDVTGTNHGSNDYWIVKLDASGNIEWNKLLGGAGSDIATDIQQSVDGGYIVAGYTNSSASGDVTGTNHGNQDYWIVKLDASGNITWNKLLGGTGIDDAFDIQQSIDGGYILAGSSTTSANGDVTGTNHGNSDCWIVKLDGSGNIVWNKLLGGSSTDVAKSILQTADGGYIFTGYSLSNNNGDVTDVNHGLDDYWVVKLDVSGNIVWNKLFGGAGEEFAYCIQRTTDGGYIVAGSSTSSFTGNVTTTPHGAEDYWIVKLDGSGNIVWNKLYGGLSTEIPYSIKQTIDGGYIVAGTSFSFTSGDVTGLNHGTPDYWIVKLDASGLRLIIH